MSEEKTTFKDELENIINALFALMPTANRITQFILLADGQDFEVMREAYPELLGDKKIRDRFFRIFGYKVEDGKIREAYASSYDIAYIRIMLKNLIEYLFKILGRDENRDTVTATLLKEIPNPEEEWLVFRLQALKEASPLAITILKVWKELAKETKTYDFEIKELSEAIKRHTEISEEQLDDALDMLIRYKLITKTYGDKYTFSEELKKYGDVLDEIE